MYLTHLIVTEINNGTSFNITEINFFEDGSTSKSGRFSPENAVREILSYGWLSELDCVVLPESLDTPAKREAVKAAAKAASVRTVEGRKAWQK